jgi:hypothetical protein
VKNIVGFFLALGFAPHLVFGQSENSIVMPSPTPSATPAESSVTAIKPIRIPYKEPFNIGHLLTPSLSTLRKGQWTIGTTAMGVGLSDDAMIVTSPWLLGYYNMMNFVIRLKVPDFDPKWGYQFGYFKTQPSLGKTYKMEAYGGWLVHRFRISQFYRIGVSLNYFHYLNEEVPWSLKRRSYSRNEASEKGQWSLTTLHEVTTGSPVRLNIEAGVLGLTSHYPNYHFGASVGYRWSKGFIQIGLSATGYFQNMTKSAYNQVYPQYKDNPNATIDFNSAYLNSVAVHPELQFQLVL